MRASIVVASFREGKDEFSMRRADEGFMTL
jgi:hypothetical protein